jgi:hypothetical protein
MGYGIVMMIFGFNNVWCMVCEWFLHYGLEDASYGAHQTMVYERVSGALKGDKAKFLLVVFAFAYVVHLASRYGKNCSLKF